MAFNPLSGTLAGVKIGSTNFAFDTWEADMSTGLPKVTNFTSNGAQVLVNGVYKGTIRLSGPYDQGNMPFTVGGLYTFVLQYTPSISLSIPAYVQSIKMSDKAEDAARVQLTCESSGTFTAAIT